MIAGIDGCTGRRWIAAIDVGHGHTKIELIESFHILLLREELSLIVIDVPIGLMDVGDRECDKAARKLVGIRRNSVFPAPLRSMLDAVDYDDACRKRYAVEKKKCSVQLYAILPTIREVDAQLTPGLQSRVREGHPEVSFALLNGASPMRYTKKSPQGRDERLSLLVRHFPDLHEQIANLSRPGVETDVVDAYALLWTARRLRDGYAKCLPENPQYDSRGLRAEIVA